MCYTYPLHIFLVITLLLVLFLLNVFLLGYVLLLILGVFRLLLGDLGCSLCGALFTHGVKCVVSGVWNSENGYQ